MGLFNREPAAILGIIAACVVAVIQTLAGQGVITNETSTTVQNLIVVAVPLIAAILTRFIVYSPASVAKLTGK